MPGFFLLVAILAGGAYPGHALDWPQYRGGNHDGTSTDRILKTWPAAGPSENWRIPCTNGLSSFSVSGGRAFTQVRRDIGDVPREVCVALEASTGAELWSTDIDQATYDSGVGSDDGPRSTPTAEGGRVYVLSSRLVLQCLDATNGVSIWRKDLRTLFGGSVIGWQSAASPLLENGLLYVNCCATTQSLLALRASDGSLVWRKQNEAMTHATPVAATIQGVRQIIFATQSGLVSLNPADGTLLWKSAYPFRYDTSLAASPLVHSNWVFISANYTMGSYAARIDFTNGAWTTTPIWTNANYKAHWMSPVCRDGFIYGLFGSSTTASLKCIDIRNGSQKWSQSGFGRGGVLLVDNVLMVMAERGDLVLVSAQPNAYAEQARWTVFPGYNADNNKCWNVPAVCDGRVYVRSTAEAVCLNIAVPAVRILAPTLAGGSLSLRIATADGSALAPERVAAMQVRFAADLSAPMSTWAVLPGLVWTNGEAEVIDPGAGGACRFYVVTETP